MVNVIIFIKKREKPGAGGAVQRVVFSNLWELLAGRGCVYGVRHEALALEEALLILLSFGQTF